MSRSDREGWDPERLRISVQQPQRIEHVCSFLQPASFKPSRKNETKGRSVRVDDDYFERHQEFSYYQYMNKNNDSIDPAYHGKLTGNFTSTKESSTNKQEKSKMTTISQQITTRTSKNRRIPEGVVCPSGQQPAKIVLIYYYFLEKSLEFLNSFMAPHSRQRAIRSGSSGGSDKAKTRRRCRAVSKIPASPLMFLMFTLPSLVYGQGEERR
jgi:hypothetical protein